MYDFVEFRKALKDALEWLKKEFAVIRASRATASVLDNVFVDTYGAKMKLNQVASIVGIDSKSLLVTPWDKSVAPNIDRAIREANLGLSVSVDAQGIRISFPDLTTDRRALLIKTVKEKLEEARVRVRNERQKIINEIDRKQLGEDEQKRLKNEFQKLVDDANRDLEELAQRKEKEISE